MGQAEVRWNIVIDKLKQAAEYLDERALDPSKWSRRVRLWFVLLFPITVPAYIAFFAVVMLGWFLTILLGGIILLPILWILEGK